MANWTQSKVNELISCYEEHPCLYDATLKEYFNRSSTYATTPHAARNTVGSFIFPSEE